MFHNTIFVWSQEKTYMQEYDLRSPGYQVVFFEVPHDDGDERTCLQFGVMGEYLWMEYSDSFNVYDVTTRTLLLEYFDYGTDSVGFIIPGHYIEQEKDGQIIFNLLTQVESDFKNEVDHCSYSTPLFGVLLGLRGNGLEIHKKVYAIKHDKRDIVCEACGEICEKKELCGDCFSQFYCSKMCQEEAWPIHRSHCNPIVLSQVVKD
jgi:hypothetical protein